MKPVAIPPYRSERFRQYLGKAPSAGTRKVRSQSHRTVQGVSDQFEPLFVAGGHFESQSHVTAQGVSDELWLTNDRNLSRASQSHLTAQGVSDSTTA